MDDNAKVLEPLYTPDELATLARVRALVQTQSNTMLRGTDGIDGARDGSLAANLAKESLHAIVGWKARAVANAVMAGGRVFGATIDPNAALRDVMTRAYLDPEFSRALLLRDVTPAQKNSVYVQGASDPWHQCRRKRQCGATVSLMMGSDPAFDSATRSAAAILEFSATLAEERGLNVAMLYCLLIEEAQKALVAIYGEEPVIDMLERFVGIARTLGRLSPPTRH